MPKFLIRTKTTVVYENDIIVEAPDQQTAKITAQIHRVAQNKKAPLKYEDANERTVSSVLVITDPSGTSEIDSVDFITDSYVALVEHKVGSLTIAVGDVSKFKRATATNIIVTFSGQELIYEMLDFFSKWEPDVPAAEKTLQEQCEDLAAQVIKITNETLPDVEVLTQGSGQDFDNDGSPDSAPTSPTYKAYQAFIRQTGGTSPLRYEIISGTLPPGLVLEQNFGYITGIPTTGGIYDFTVRITDILQNIVEKEYSIKVPQLPQITTVGEVSAANGTPYLYNINARPEASGTSKLVWSVITAPMGFKIDSSSGIITWKPTATGIVSFKIQVANNAGTYQQEVTVTVI